MAALAHKQPHCLILGILVSVFLATNLAAPAQTQLSEALYQPITRPARNDNGSFGPAYARYSAIVGSNFLSNTWRVHSEANTHDALLRASEGFAGRMASNAFSEFWPDIKKRLLRKHN
jgi:hypothetical protein